MPNTFLRTVRPLALWLVSAMLAAQAVNALAQQDQAASAPHAVAMGAVVEVTTRVVAIDPATNTVTLRGPRGNEAEVEVAPEIGDVKRLKIGDIVHVTYKGALLLSVEKVGANTVRSRTETEATTPASGGTVVSVHHIELVATVQKIDKKNREVTLRGPKHSVALQVGPDVDLDKLKVGDNIRADYIGAIALHVDRKGAGTGQ